MIAMRPTHTPPRTGLLRAPIDEPSASELARTRGSRLGWRDAGRARVWRHDAARLWRSREHDAGCAPRARELSATVAPRSRVWLPADHDERTLRGVRSCHRHGGAAVRRDRRARGDGR